ncbi:hypothetical protein L211DRAFT_631451 [Terfezia boudieri ATCC MYA-4762]|uniref:Uncharacterized protein n=1 Tax=Terfezia boudieri ATCC MYA-4762 TaxID=1051890 RepID=A0A3N4LNI0_9PEZI|nr:hypothetical protein L211DRAFT_631451 [Terfezia boudieri ATCC MYA-4762]
MTAEFCLDSDEEEEMRDRKEEEGEVVVVAVVEVETNDCMATEVREEEGLGDGSSEDPAAVVSKTVIGEDGKTFLNPASLGRAPKLRPHPRYDFLPYPQLLNLQPPSLSYSPTTYPPTSHADIPLPRKL